MVVVRSRPSPGGRFPCGIGHRGLNIHQFDIGLDQFLRGYRVLLVLENSGGSTGFEKGEGALNGS